MFSPADALHLTRWRRWTKVLAGVGGAVWSKNLRLTMSPACCAAMRRSDFWPRSLRSPAIERIALSRQGVAARVLAAFSRVGSRSAPGQLLLSTPRSGPVTARRAAPPSPTWTVTSPAVVRVGPPHDPVLTWKWMVCEPGTEKVNGTENVPMWADGALRHASSPNLAAGSSKSKVTPPTGLSPSAAIVKLVGRPVTGASGTIRRRTRGPPRDVMTIREVASVDPGGTAGMSPPLGRSGSARLFSTEPGMTLGTEGAACVAVGGGPVSEGAVSVVPVDVAGAGGARVAGPGGGVVVSVGVVSVWVGWCLSWPKWFPLSLPAPLSGTADATVPPAATPATTNPTTRHVRRPSMTCGRPYARCRPVARARRYRPPKSVV